VRKQVPKTLSLQKRSFLNIIMNKLIQAAILMIAFISIFKEAKAQWTPTAGPNGGYVSAIVVSGTNIFAGSHEGVFISGNNGTSWTAVNTGLPQNPDVLSLAVFDNNIFAITSGGGVYLSGNNGSSWTAPKTAVQGGVQSLAFNNLICLYCTLCYLKIPSAFFKVFSKSIPF
jgi:hypothetical protein